MTRARQVRKAAGFTLAEASKRLGRTRAHVAYLERSGQWPWGLLQTAMRLYGCRAQDLLPCGRSKAMQGGEAAAASPAPESRGDLAAQT